MAGKFFRISNVTIWFWNTAGPRPCQVSNFAPVCALGVLEQLPAGTALSLSLSRWG